MASPITVATTPIMLVNVNINRDVVQFQNNGKKDVFVKKQKSNTITDVPSDTNYDFILKSDNSIVDITSVSAFAGVTVSSGSSDVQVGEVGILETIKTNLC